MLYKQNEKIMELSLKEKQKKNEQFFRKVAQLAKIYTWPDKGHSYRIINNCFYGSKKAIEDIKAITPKTFWVKLFVE